MRIKELHDWNRINSAYISGKLYVWTVCPEDCVGTDEYYEPHWHPVTELPCWGDEWLAHTRFGVR